MAPEVGGLHVHALLVRFIRLLAVLVTIAAGAVLAAQQQRHGRLRRLRERVRRLERRHPARRQGRGRAAAHLRDRDPAGERDPVGDRPVDVRRRRAVHQEVEYTPSGGAGTTVSFTFTVNDGTTTSPPAAVEVGILAAPGGSIVTPGPLTRITTSPLLNCDVRHAGDASGEWYGNTACGTFVAVGTAISARPAFRRAPASPAPRATRPTRRSAKTVRRARAQPARRTC